MQNDMRDRLIELIGNIGDVINSECTLDCEGCKYEEADRCVTEILVDRLIANGAILPPCKVGDVVYLPIKTDWGTIEIYEIVEVGQDRNGIYFRVYDEEQEKIYLEELGKTVFLTEQEAREALRKEDEGK